MLNLFEAGLYWTARALAAGGIIDAKRGERTVELAWPRIVTGFARISQQVADLAMIGFVLGSAPIAGIGYAFAYWQIGNQISLGLSGGAIALVSQHFGVKDEQGIDLVTKQAIWIAIGIATPISAVYWVFAPDLVRLLGADTIAAGYGTIYLRVMGLALVFEFMNKIASRVLVGSDDALTPMYVRGGGAVANLLFNAVFIFGFGLGVFGAALGTLIATILTTSVFAVGFLGRRLPLVGDFPANVSLTPPFVDTALMRQLLVISTPLMARWVAHSVIIFPFIAIVSVFGTGAVAAFEVGRRLRSLMHAPGWGFSLASSSLAGHELGRGDELEARAYGNDILQFAIVVYVVTAATAFVFATHLARLFVQGPDVLAQTATFIRVAAVAVIALGIDETVTGVLRSAGDTRWPMYGKFVGLYLVALPIAYLGVVTPIGLTAVFAAFVAETAFPAAVSLYRFKAGHWMAVSRTYRPDPSDG